MGSLGPLGILGFGAIAIVVVLWLVISFTPPGRGRSVLEWLGAAHLYVALIALFVNLVLRSHEADSLLGLVAFGFLLVVFALGFCVALVNTFRAAAGREGPGGADVSH